MLCSGGHPWRSPEDHGLPGWALLSRVRVSRRRLPTASRILSPTSQLLMAEEVACCQIVILAKCRSPKQFHSLVLIILGLWFYFEPYSNPLFGLQGSAAPTPLPDPRLRPSLPSTKLSAASGLCTRPLCLFPPQICATGSSLLFPAQFKIARQENAS